MPRTDPEDQSETRRLIASMQPEFREDALRIWQREALQQADAILNSGKRGDTLSQPAERVSDRKVI